MIPPNRDNLDELLSAYLDDELTETERAEVDALLEQDVSVRRRLEALRGAVELISALPRRSAPPSLVDDVMSRLERDELLDDLNTSCPRRGWQRPWLSVLASAALVAICVSGAWYIFRAPRNQAERASPAVAIHRSPATPAPERSPSDAELLMRTQSAKADRLAEGPAVLSVDDIAKAVPRPALQSEADATDRPRAVRPEGRGVTSMDKLAAAGREVAEARDRIPSRPGPDRTAVAARSREKTERDLTAESRLESVGDAGGVTGLAAQSEVPAVPASPEVTAEPTFAGAVADMLERGVSELRRWSDDTRATVDQKLAHGASPTDFAHHPFANEQAQVQVAFATEAARQAAARRIAQVLDEQAVPEVRQTAFLNFLGLAPALGRTSPFFVLGQPTVNFADPQEQQILVRVEPQHVEQLFNAVLASADRERDVTVRVGSVAARGRTAGFDLLTLGLPVFEEGAIAASESTPADAGHLKPRVHERKRTVQSAEPTDLQAKEDDYSVPQADALADDFAYDRDASAEAELRRDRPIRPGNLPTETASWSDTAREPASAEVSEALDQPEQADVAAAKAAALEEWVSILPPGHGLPPAGASPLVTVVIRLLPPGAVQAQPAVTPEARDLRQERPTPTTRPSHREDGRQPRSHGDPGR